MPHRRRHVEARAEQRRASARAGWRLQSCAALPWRRGLWNGASGDMHMCIPFLYILCLAAKVGGVHRGPTWGTSLTVVHTHTPERRRRQPRGERRKISRAQHNVKRVCVYCAVVAVSISAPPRLCTRVCVPFGYFGASRYAARNVTPHRELYHAASTFEVRHTLATRRQEEFLASGAVGVRVRLRATRAPRCLTDRLTD